jgi:large conductance mechanosensitive channel
MSGFFCVRLLLDNRWIVMSFWQDFRTFAVKGNVIDMAVGIIIGVAFNKIVTSLVNDVIMPPLGLLIGGVEFKDLQVVLRESQTLPSGEELSMVAIRYGLFINTIVEFLIIALSVFVVVKVMNRIVQFRSEGSAAE